jgi:hypothetical protein
MGCIGHYWSPIQEVTQYGGHCGRQRLNIGKRSVIDAL